MSKRDGRGYKSRPTQMSGLFQSSNGVCHCIDWATGRLKSTHTKESAKAALRLMKGTGQTRGVNNDNRRKLHAYRCPTSSWWHLGHQPARRTA